MEKWNVVRFAGVFFAVQSCYKKPKLEVMKKFVLKMDLWGVARLTVFFGATEKQVKTPENGPPVKIPAFGNEDFFDGFEIVDNDTPGWS